MSEPQIPTFIQNVEAFVNVLGPMEAPLVVDLSQVAWTTGGQRDKFIADITRRGGDSATV
jgi:hypothetical protein